MQPVPSCALTTVKESFTLAVTFTTSKFPEVSINVAKKYSFCLCI